MGLEEIKMEMLSGQEELDKISRELGISQMTRILDVVRAEHQLKNNEKIEPLGVETFMGIGPLGTETFIMR